MQGIGYIVAICGVLDTYILGIWVHMRGTWVHMQGIGYIVAICGVLGTYAGYWVHSGYIS